jgi:hypothetical protein
MLCSAWCFTSCSSLYLALLNLVLYALFLGYSTSCSALMHAEFCFIAHSASSLPCSTSCFDLLLFYMLYVMLYFILCCTSYYALLDTLLHTLLHALLHTLLCALLHTSVCFMFCIIFHSAWCFALCFVLLHTLLYALLCLHNTQSTDLHASVWCILCSASLLGWSASCFACLIFIFCSVSCFALLEPWLGSSCSTLCFALFNA